ncbi:unnamed protein product [Lepeophtheirus salmonis]|uniref:(salmon louse) hypothetical protein n=1 Tax=Lepeophtheirus salmonis TaxID=72036 RepID=A0A817FAQ2_LEPSM|nr:unnamed protein product [Lepeophtheirus salmonis]CAG9475203.1 unnamed protein product [Lepeophtheirus salmonis]
MFEDNLFIYEAMIKVLSELTIPFEDYIEVFFIKSNDSPIEEDTDSNQWSTQILEVITLIVQGSKSMKRMRVNLSFFTGRYLMNEDSSDSYTQEKNGNVNHLKNYNDDAMACHAELEETVKEMVNYWITTLPGDTKMDTEVSTESSSNDMINGFRKAGNSKEEDLENVNDLMKKRREQSTVDDEGVSRLLTKDLEVELPVIEAVFSPEIMSNIVFEGLHTLENLEMNQIQICITILCSKCHNAYNTETRYKIHKIICLFMEMRNLRHFSSFIDWKFNSSHQTRAFINDAIMSNHQLLVMFEKVESSDKFINEHLDQGESESSHYNLPITDEDIELSSPSSSETVYVDEIEGLKDVLLIQGEEYLIHCLQEEIINVIDVDINEISNSLVQYKKGILEPIAYYSFFWNESIPIIPWTINQESRLQKNYFLMLLKKIGIYLLAMRHTRNPYDTERLAN